MVYDVYILQLKFIYMYLIFMKNKDSKFNLLYEWFNLYLILTHLTNCEELNRL